MVARPVGGDLQLVGVGIERSGVVDAQGMPGEGRAGHQGDQRQEGESGDLDQMLSGWLVTKRSISLSSSLVVNLLIREYTYLN